MIPLHVCAQDQSGLWLIRDGVAAFRVIDPGPLLPLITGADFILAERNVAEALLVACPDDISLRPVTVRRHSTSEAWASHVEMTVNNILTPDALPLSEFEERRAWCFAQAHLFVHPEVGAALADLDLRFSEGFTDFAGWAV